MKSMNVKAAKPGAKPEDQPAELVEAAVGPAGNLMTEATRKPANWVGDVVLTLKILVVFGLVGLVIWLLQIASTKLS